MNTANRSRLMAGAGIALLLVGVMLLFASVPSYTTGIEAEAADERAMADRLDQYSAAEIATVPFAALSPAEQTAFDRARTSPQRRYTGSGAADDGSTFRYRNDVVNQYFVTYDGSVYLTTVVIDIHPLVRASGALCGLSAVFLLAFAYWRT